MASPAHSNRFLATAALAGLATFPIIVVALHIVQRGEYHPLGEAVSQLALGRAGWLMWIAFCAAGTGLICLGILHRRLVESSRTAPVLLVVAGLLAYVSAVFHADPENATTTSLHDEIHQTASLIAFICVIAAMFISNRRFKRDPRWRRFARPTLVWAIASVATLFLIPVVGDSLFGLAQRIFIATWLSWAIATSARARAVTSAQEAPSLEAEVHDAVPA
jgi:hypothetical membrane protein